jgi:hypothetical protein
MCEECKQLNLRIDHCRLLASRITDQQMLNGITELTEKMNAKKSALHLELRSADQLAPVIR